MESANEWRKVGITVSRAGLDEQASCIEEQVFNLALKDWEKSKLGDKFE